LEYVNFLIRKHSNIASLHIKVFDIPRQLCYVKWICFGKWKFFPIQIFQVFCYKCSIFSIFCIFFKINTYSLIQWVCEYAVISLTKVQSTLLHHHHHCIRMWMRFLSSRIEHARFSPQAGVSPLWQLNFHCLRFFCQSFAVLWYSHISRLSPAPVFVFSSVYLFLLSIQLKINAGRLLDPLTIHSLHVPQLSQCRSTQELFYLLYFVILRIILLISYFSLRVLLHIMRNILISVAFIFLSLSTLLRMGRFCVIRCWVL